VKNLLDVYLKKMAILKIAKVWPKYFANMDRYTEPMISCICVTRGKPSLLMRAVECFETQTHKHKELIVVFEDDDYITREACKRVSKLFIKMVEIGASPKRTLGALRNIAIAEASGEFVCQWDDDDWYHCRRLEIQLKAIRQTGFPGCFLARWLVFDTVCQKSFISNQRIWEGSILCRKDVIIQKPYPDLVKGEDTEVLEYLYANDYLIGLDDPSLYIYVYHGRNTFGREHWEYIFECSAEVSADTNDEIVSILKQQNNSTEASGLLDQHFLRYKKCLVYRWEI